MPDQEARRSSKARWWAPLRFALVACAMLMTPVRESWADEVYKSVDPQGHLVFSDRAPSAKAEKSVVHVIQSDPAEAARAAQETRILKAEENVRKREEAAQSARQAKADQDRKVQCRNARNHYYSIKDSNLLYKLDQQGNRVFYSDTEADARKEQARQAMVSACGQ